MNKQREKVLGYYVDLMTFDEAVSFVMNKASISEGIQIVTINPEIIELANKNKNYSQILENAELVIPDGSGIKLALKLKGIKQEQIPGIDISKKIIEQCAYKNYPISLIGAKEEIIQKTIENLKTEFNDLNITYARNGYFSESDEKEIIENIKKSKPKLVLVALGAPKQEFFINKCRKEIKDSIFIGVGGSFDVWAGSVERAPQIYRKFGCEWIYRTIKQPERIKRIYKTLPLFLFKVIIESLKTKKEKK